MIDIAHVSMLDLLPPNLARDDRLRAAAMALDAELQAVTSEINLLPVLPNIDSMPESIIDELIWQYHVEGAELATTLDEKRALVRNSTEIHRTKGTRYALERVIDLLGMRAIISEWSEHDGDPYTFRIEVLEVTNKGLTEEKLRLLDRLIVEYKNTRSWLTSIRVYLTTRGHLYHAFNTSGGEAVTVYPWSVGEIESRGRISMAQTAIQTEVITVYP